MSDSQKRLVALSAMHASMLTICNFTDPDVMACCRPKMGKRGKSPEVSKKEQWLYDRLMVIHRFAKEAMERDEREAEIPTNRGNVHASPLCEGVCEVASS